MEVTLVICGYPCSMVKNVFPFRAIWVNNYMYTSFKGMQLLSTFLIFVPPFANLSTHLPTFHHFCRFAYLLSILRQSCAHFLTLVAFSNFHYISTQFFTAHKFWKLLLLFVYFHLPPRRRPRSGDIATPPSRLSVRLSVCPSVRLSVCPSVHHV